MVISSGKFIFRLAAFSVFLLVVSAVSQKFFPSSINYAYSHVLIAWYFLLTASVHLILMKTGGGDEKGFIRAFMATVTLRFMIHMAIIFLWAYTHRETAVAFIVTYFVLYLCYTLFEILMLMKVIIKSKAMGNKNPLT